MDKMNTFGMNVVAFLEYHDKFHCSIPIQLVVLYKQINSTQRSAPWEAGSRLVSKEFPRLLWNSKIVTLLPKHYPWHRPEDRCNI
jgi:hypothetical protein